MLVILIVLAILAVGTFIGFHLPYKAMYKSDDRYEQRAAKKFKTLRTIVPSAILVLMVLTFVLGGIKIVDSTQVGVVKTFGNISNTISSGLNLVNPISDTVDIYDLRVHVREATFASYTKDAQPLQASVEYQYALQPEYVMQVAREYGSQEILESKLNSVVEEKVKVVFAEYGAMSLLEHRSQLSTECFSRMSEIQDLFHIRFTSVVVNNLDFSDAFEQSVEAKMKAEQDALKAEQDKKKAVIEAEQGREVAKINAEAAIAQAEGEAQAMKIVREALENMPDAYIQQLWIDKWDGKLPTVQAGDTGSVIVNPGVAGAGYNQ